MQWWTRFASGKASAAITVMLGLRLCVPAYFRDPQSFMLKMANLIFAAGIACWCDAQP